MIIRPIVCMALYGLALGTAVGFAIAPQFDARTIAAALSFGALFGGYEFAQQYGGRNLAGRFVAIAAGACALAIIAAGVGCVALGRCL